MTPWERLRKHKVAQWTLAYGAAAYTLLHIVEMIGGALDWPHFIVRIVALLLLLGVPVATTLAWFHGHRAQHRISSSEFAILTVLLVISSAVLWIAGRPSHERAADRDAALADATSGKLLAAVAAAPEKSIAVLPFVDMSEKKDQEYFSDGLSEELIDHLTRAPGLKVIARTSSFRFKGRSDDVRAIAGMLGVAHLLEGSVRKSGNALRITVQLVKASDGTHVWSQTYDRTLDDVFKVQSEIARTVAQTLKTSLDKSSGLVMGDAASTEAYSLVLKGNFFFSRWGPGDLAKAIELYQEAIRLSPTYPQPWAQLAEAYLYAQVRLIPRADAYAKARAAAQQSLRLDPNLLKGHFVLGMIYREHDRNWSAAQTEIDRMREIDPENAVLLPSATADLAAVFGRLDEAITIRERMLERDPLNTFALQVLVSNYFDANRREKAVEMAQRVIELNPNFPGCQACLAVVLGSLGHAGEAVSMIEAERDDVARIANEPIVYWLAGRHAESDRALDLAKRRFGDSLAYPIACTYAARGDLDAAFKWLDRAYDEHDPNLAEVKTDVLLIHLRNDPRFLAFLVKMKLDGDRPQVGL